MLSHRGGATKNEASHTTEPPVNHQCCQNHLETIFVRIRYKFSSTTDPSTKNRTIFVSFAATRELVQNHRHIKLYDTTSLYKLAWCNTATMQLLQICTPPRNPYISCLYHHENTMWHNMTHVVASNPYMWTTRSHICIWVVPSRERNKRVSSDYCCTFVNSIVNKTSEPYAKNPDHIVSLDLHRDEEPKGRRSFYASTIAIERKEAVPPSMVAASKKKNKQERITQISFPIQKRDWGPKLIGIFL